MITETQTLLSPSDISPTQPGSEPAPMPEPVRKTAYPSWGKRAAKPKKKAAVLTTGSIQPARSYIDLSSLPRIPTDGLENLF